MGRKLSRIERRKQRKEDPKSSTWDQYKKPTSKGLFYHTFQKNSISAGEPIEEVFDRKGLQKEVSDFLNDFKQFEAVNLAYLESVLPIRYCLILPRNHAALLFALYVNAIANEKNISFIDCYRNIDQINARFEKPANEFQDKYLLNTEFRNKLLEIFERRRSAWSYEWIVGKKKPTGVFYLINAEMQSPGLPQRFKVTLLFDLEIFGNPKHKFHAFLNFSNAPHLDIPEGITFFEKKKKIRKEQDIEIFYKNGTDSVISKKIHWKPHAHIAKMKMKKIKPNLRKLEEKEITITADDARKLIEGHNPKILVKSENKKFLESLQFQTRIKKACDITKEFELFLPREYISINNYFLLVNITGPPIGRFYPLETNAYVVVRRHLFLYNLVGTFRTIIGLTKRRKREGIVEFYTPPVIEEIPAETREILKSYATPSQVLFNIVQNAEQNHGDVELSLKYIRGIYRASRKISLMLKNKQYNLIPKVVARYL